MNIKNKSILLCSLLVSLSGCASNNFLVQGQYQTPPEISFVWDDSVNTYVVPQKGVLLSRAVFTDDKQSTLLESGSYFYVQGVYQKIILANQNNDPLVILKK